MELLSQDIITQIGSYLDYKERVSCFKTAKCFATISHYPEYNTQFISVTQENYAIKLDKERCLSGLAYLKRFKPYLSTIVFEFENVSILDTLEFEPLEIPDLCVKVEITGQSNIPSVIKCFAHIDVLNIDSIEGFQQQHYDLLVSYINRVDKIKVFSLDYENAFQNKLLKNTEFANKLYSLKINVANRHIDLRSIPNHISLLHVSSQYNDLDITDAHKIHRLDIFNACYRIDTHLVESFRNCKQPLNIMSVVIYDLCESTIDQNDHIWFRLIECLPSTVTFYIMDNCDPKTIGWLRHIINNLKRTNMILVYSTPSRYLSCRIAKHFNPDLRIEPAIGYEAPLELQKPLAMKEIYELLIPQKQILWTWLLYMDAVVTT